MVAINQCDAFPSLEAIAFKRDAPEQGQFLLFEIHAFSKCDERGCHSGDWISTPVFAMSLGMAIWDQALAFYYIEPRRNGQLKIHGFGDWMDHIHILGKWTARPKFREVMAAYRQSLIAKCPDDPRLTPKAELLDIHSGWNPYFTEANV